MTTTEAKTRTITLTNRPPVRIREDQWPQIAQAKRWDNQYESQAIRTWALRVRQHEDGRTIVYGAYDSRYAGEHGRRAGELLDAGADIAASIRRVGEHAGCDDCIDDCIADLPAVELE